MKKVSMMMLTLSAASLISLSAQAAGPVNFPAGASTWTGYYTVTGSGSSCTNIAPPGNQPAKLQVTSSSQDSNSGDINFKGTLTLAGFNNSGTSFPNFGQGADIGTASIMGQTFYAPLYPVYMTDIGLSNTSGYNDSKPPAISVQSSSANSSCIVHVGPLVAQ